MTFVVSYLSFFTNELESIVVQCDSEIEAFLQGIYTLQCRSISKHPTSYQDDEFLSSLSSLTVEEIKQAMFDCDIAVNIIKVS